MTPAELDEIARDLASMPGGEWFSPIGRIPQDDLVICFNDALNVAAEARTPEAATYLIHAANHAPVLAREMRRLQTELADVAHVVNGCQGETLVEKVSNLLGECDLLAGVDHPGPCGPCIICEREAADAARARAEAAQLREQLATLEAVRRGDECEANGDGPCGVCLKCVGRLRAHGEVPE